MEKDPEAGARVWAGEVKAVGEVRAAARAVVGAGEAVRWRPGREGIVYAPTAGSRLVTLSGSRVIG